MEESINHEEEQQHYDLLMKHLTECNIIQFAIENKIPTYRTLFALSDYLATICFLEGRQRGEDDFFMKLMIEKLQEMHFEYMQAKNLDDFTKGNQEN